MATNFRANGKVSDANLIILTGDTITGGSLIFCDVSGTNVVRAVRGYSGATPESNVTLHSSGTGAGFASRDTNLFSGAFLGVIANTQTGVGNLSGGHQTGIAWYNDGIFEFRSSNSAQAAMSGGAGPLRVGYPVWAMNHDTVVCLLSGLATADATATNTTGTNPIGVVVATDRPIATNTVPSRVWVSIKPGRTIQAG